MENIKLSNVIFFVIFCGVFLYLYSLLHNESLVKASTLLKTSEKRMDRSGKLLDRDEVLQDREEKELAREEQNQTRYEKIMDKWEAQQAQYQKYLDGLPNGAR